MQISLNIIDILCLHILKTLIHKNILPTDPNKKNKTYYIL